MAEIGYGDEFWLHDGTALVKLPGVKSFDTAVGGVREQIDVTALDAQDWNRQYASGYYEDRDIEVTMNAQFLSTADTLLTDARDQGDERAFMQAFAENGVPTSMITGTCRCTGYTYGTISAGDVKESTATFRIVSVEPVVPYVAPGV